MSGISKEYLGVLAKSPATSFTHEDQSPAVTHAVHIVLKLDPVQEAHTKTHMGGRTTYIVQEGIRRPMARLFGPSDRGAVALGIAENPTKLGARWIRHPERVCLPNNDVIKFFQTHMASFPQKPIGIVVVDRSCIGEGECHLLQQWCKREHVPLCFQVTTDAITSLVNPSTKTSWCDLAIVISNHGHGAAVLRFTSILWLHLHCRDVEFQTWVQQRRPLMLGPQMSTIKSHDIPESSVILCEAAQLDITAEEFKTTWRKQCIVLKTQYGKDMPSMLPGIVPAGLWESRPSKLPRLLRNLKLPTLYTGQTTYSVNPALAEGLSIEILQYYKMPVPSSALSIATQAPSPINFKNDWGLFIGADAEKYMPWDAMHVHANDRAYWEHGIIQALMRLMEVSGEIIPSSMGCVVIEQAASDSNSVLLEALGDHSAEQAKVALIGNTYVGTWGKSATLQQSMPNSHFKETSKPFKFSCSRPYARISDALAAKRMSADEEKVLHDLHICHGESPLRCVMLETVDTFTAMFHSKVFLQALRDFCTTQGIPLIFDEALCGSGRTGKVFAFNWYGIIPDYATLGKAISSSTVIAFGEKAIAKGFFPKHDVTDRAPMAGPIVARLEWIRSHIGSIRDRGERIRGILAKDHDIAGEGLMLTSKIIPKTIPHFFTEGIVDYARALPPYDITPDDIDRLLGSS